jgi:hypothetical protein
MGFRRFPAIISPLGIVRRAAQTAKANGLEPRAYLNFLFEHLPEATTPAVIQALLAQALKPDDLNL